MINQHSKPTWTGFISATNKSALLSHSKIEFHLYLRSLSPFLWDKIFRFSFFIKEFLGVFFCRGFGLSEGSVFGRGIFVQILFSGRGFQFFTSRGVHFFRHYFPVLTFRWGAFLGRENLYNIFYTFFPGRGIFDFSFFFQRE